MTKIRALIVDDSKTAQYRLKKLLDRYELEVDLATSAEEALGYLSYKMPTVIFMDHHMEGMDGFDALKIIKANPTTAMIPVIMYTSKSDELYAGQAHALGALDTLSKGLMKPERVEEVLAKLRIYPIDESSLQENEENPSPIQVTHHGEEPPYNPTDTNDQEVHISAAELKGQIARLFELHIADVRTQISENTKFVVRKLAGDIKSVAHKNEDSNNLPVDASNDEDGDDSEPRTNPVTSNWLLALIFVSLGLISIQIFQSEKQTQRLQENYAQLADANLQNTLLLDDIISMSSQDDISLPSQINYTKLLDTLSWALQVDMRFDYDEEPLNDSQVLNLQTLTFRLHESGFRGLVELDVRLGDYCLIQADGGQWITPNSDTPMSECSVLSEQDNDQLAENYTSLAYLRFEQTAAPVKNGEIEFMINVSAFENPLYEYPDRLPGTTAGRWNAVAAKNQQIVMSVQIEDYTITAK